MDINSLHKKAITGDKLAEDELFRQLSARFLYFARQRIVNRHDCEEIVQNALMSISGKFMTIEITVSFSSWAYRVFENKIIDHLRAGRSRKDRFTQAPELDYIKSKDNPDYEFKRKLLGCLRKVRNVNNRFARILVLRYLGYEFDEICDRLKITRQNGYSILSRARDMLDKCLHKGDR